MALKFISGVALMLALAMSAACSQMPAPSVAGNERLPMNNTVPGSYIVNAPADGEQVIRRVFTGYGVVLVRPLGHGQYELRLQRDPGLDALKSAASGSDGAVTEVQPDYVYHPN